MKNKKIEDMIMIGSLFIMNGMMFIPMIPSSCPILETDENGNSFYSGSTVIHNAVIDMADYSWVEIPLFILFVISLIVVIGCGISLFKGLDKRRLYIRILFLISNLLFVICLLIGMMTKITYM